MKIDKKLLLQTAGLVFLTFLCIYYWEGFTGFLDLLFHAAFPLLLGCGIAYVVNILMSFYEKYFFPASKKPAVRKIARPLCMAGAFLTLILIALTVFRIVMPELISCIHVLLAEVPGAIDNLIGKLSESQIFSKNADILPVLEEIDWKATADKVLKGLADGLGTTVGATVGVLSSAASAVINLVIGTIFAIYILIGKHRLGKQFSRVLEHYLRPSWNRRFRYVLGIVDDCFHKYIVGQCTEAVILGALCALGMALFGFPYAAMTGTVIGVTALIPIAGAYIGGIVGFLLILTISPLKACLFIVYLVILQQLEGNLIYPKVVGASLGLPGLWVLAAVTVGGGIWGIMGMLLGVPLTAVCYQLLRNDLNAGKKTAEL